MDFFEDWLVEIETINLPTALTRYFIATVIELFIACFEKAVIGVAGFKLGSAINAKQDAVLEFAGIMIGKPLDYK